MTRAARRRARRHIPGDWVDALCAAVADIDRVRDHDQVVGALVLAVLTTPPGGGPGKWWVTHGVHAYLATSPPMLLHDAAAAIEEHGAAQGAEDHGDA